MNQRHTKQTIKDLTATRQLLIDGGWTQGRRLTPEGEHCLYGALEEVTLGGVHRNSWEQRGRKINRFSRAKDAVKVAIPRSFDDGWVIITWNDEPDRTVEEVLDLLDIAIERVGAS